MAVKTALPTLEETISSHICVVYNMMEDIKQCLLTGTSKSTFGLETDSLLSELENTLKEKIVLNFQAFFSRSFSKLNKYLDVHTVYNSYKTTWLFDSRQLPYISHDIGSFPVIEVLKDSSADLLEEFQIYVNYQNDLLNPFNIPAFWNTNKFRFPLLEQISHKKVI